MVRILNVRQREIHISMKQDHYLWHMQVKIQAASQFFIVHEPQPHLDGVHTVFGKVTSGLRDCS